MIDAHLNCRKADARQDAKPTLKRSPGKTKRKSTFAKVDRSLVGCRALNLMCVCVKQRCLVSPGSAQDFRRGLFQYGISVNRLPDS